MIKLCWIFFGIRPTYPPQISSGPSLIQVTITQGRNLPSTVDANKAGNKVKVGGETSARYLEQLL